MLTVRPLVVSVLFIRIKKFLSLVCSVRDFLLRPESNTYTVNVGNSQKFVSLQENLLSTKNILKIQRTAELRKHTKTGFAESLWPQTNRTNTH